MCSKRTFQLYASGAHPCQYLPEREARTLFVDPETALDPAAQTLLQRQGLRRSGPYLYQPGCDGCQACKSLRIPVDSFAPSRSQARCWRRNSDLHLHWSEAHIGDEHVALYQSYLAARHGDSPMREEDGNAPDMAFLTAPWADTSLLDMRLNGQLVATAVTDHVVDGLSAVYTFFSPTHARRGLGNFAILCQIEWARMNALPYVYLGYWIAAAPTMRYKAGFRPCEVFDAGRWQTLPPDASAQTIGINTAEKRQ